MRRRATFNFSLPIDLMEAFKTRIKDQDDKQSRIVRAGIERYMSGKDISGAKAPADGLKVHQLAFLKALKRYAEKKGMKETEVMAAYIKKWETASSGASG